DDQMETGEYQYNILTGTYPDAVVTVAGFNFIVTEDPSVNASAVNGGSGGRALVKSTSIPEDFLVNPNYPNPFNPGTTIQFGVPEAAEVLLIVYDMLGRQVDVLINGTVKAGYHQVYFDASHLPSGTYIYKLETPTGSHSQSMQLLK
ncbi:MAG: T9SS type A sorting domain-containing protein, partial [Bacteroidota bacterium]